MSQPTLLASDPFVQQLLEEMEEAILALPGAVRTVTSHGCICITYCTPETERVDKKRHFSHAEEGFETKVYDITLTHHRHQGNVACLRKNILTMVTTTYELIDERHVESTSRLELSGTTTGLQLISSDQGSTRKEQPMEHDYGKVVQDVITNTSLLTVSSLNEAGLRHVRDRVVVEIEEV